MKYPIIFSMLFASLLTAEIKAQNNQQQPQPTPEYPLQKNAESENQETQAQAANDKKPLTPEQKAQKQTDHLQKKLGLTEEQKQKVYNLNYSRITKSQAARDKYKNDKQAAKTEFQKIRTDFDSGLKDILNDDQEKTWAQLKADAKARRDAHHQQKGSKQKQEPPATEDPDNLDVD